MDPLRHVGLRASVEGLIGGAIKTVPCAKIINDGRKERSRLLAESIALRGISTTFAQDCDSNENMGYDL